MRESAVQCSAVYTDWCAGGFSCLLCGQLCGQFNAKLETTEHNFHDY